MAGKRVEAFVLATGWEGALPRSMLDTFFELDSFMGKMESQKLERDAKAKKNAR